MPLFYLCLIAAELVFTPGPVRADDAPLGPRSGSAALKASHQSIRMDSEEVTIRLLKKSYTVDAVFRFSNTGETTTEWVGFPKRGTEEGSFIRFQTWIDGRGVDVSEDPEWFKKQVTFPGHATTTTRVRYEAPYRGHAVVYIYGTGAYWKDSIGKATFIINGAGAERFPISFFFPDTVSHIIRRRVLSENVVMYEIKDFKPNVDGELSVFVGGF